jgi:signal transduction histidine kinase
VLVLARNLSIDLSPPILRDEGLTEAVGWLASQMYEQHGLRIELQAEETFAIPDEDIQVLLFNCVRELLFNIVKHAGVKEAIVSLQRSNADLTIEVRDAGKGFNPALLDQRNGKDEDELQSRSFGLPTLLHRLSLFGGRMEIQSAPGAGTQVTLIIPVFGEGSKASSLPRRAILK